MPSRFWNACSRAVFPRLRPRPRLLMTSASAITLRPRARPRDSPGLSVPPCASAICRERARPIPEPPGLVVKNGTNKFVGFMIPVAFIAHKNFHALACFLPADGYCAARWQRRFGGVVQQINQHLFHLRCIGTNRNRRTTLPLHRQSRFQIRRPLSPLRQYPISSFCGGGNRASRAYASMKRLSESARVAIDVQPAARIVVPVSRQRIAPQQILQTSRNRFDRRERIIHFMTENAHQSLPGDPLLFPQSAAQIRQHE